MTPQNIKKVIINVDIHTIVLLKGDNLLAEQEGDI